MSATVPRDAEAVISFWFGELSEHGVPAPEHTQRWFRSSPGFDAECRSRFGERVEQALGGELEAWAKEPRGRLALVLLLDQLTRNVYRGTAKAFAGDPAARRHCLAAVDAGTDQALLPIERNFLYMPLMHAEDLALQERSVELFGRLAASATPALAERLTASRDYAISHRDAIVRFGRFPGRNAALGREDTPDEREYLESGGGY